MSDRIFPPNVYHLPQCRFDAIPGSPWVYWVSDSIRKLFETLPRFSMLVLWKRGCTTTDNTRFIRYWWEVREIDTDRFCHSTEQASRSSRRWFPYAKGSGYKKWYAPVLAVVNWASDGLEIKEEIIHRYPYLGGKWEWVAKNADYYFKMGLAYSSVTSGSFSARYLVPGAIFDQGANALFADKAEDIPHILGVLNSSFVDWVLRLNPTINVVKDDLDRVPLATDGVSPNLVISAVFQVRLSDSATSESTLDFTAPLSWGTGLEDAVTVQTRLAGLEKQIDEEVYHVYELGTKDRATIEAELAGRVLTSAEALDREIGDTQEEDEDEQGKCSVISQQELAIRWISFAIGIVLGRFQPGLPAALGSAVYHRANFAVGSLPTLEEEEFDTLVGTTERFAYVDAEGGRHVFSSEVESALRGLAVPDGITVLDKGHPHDLPALVDQALTLMLGPEAAQEVIVTGAGGDLRRFLERDFFTKWHLKWYRKRPVYWPLQSSRRSYGFVLFHEHVSHDILYTLQRDYLDYKLNGLRLQIGELEAQREKRSGRDRKQVEQRLDQAAQLLDELSVFAATIDRLAREGYEPAPDWIDDGIILRLAPLWELLPIWKSEPKKYWGRLQAGDYDWSHIAMRYWPERVKEKCGTNKSFAIAHGHEEWYLGG